MSETTNGETVYFVNDVNRAYEQVLQTYDEEGVIDTYTYGLQRIQSVGETTETYLYDGRGSAVGSVSEDLMTSYAYTAYGELMPDSLVPSVFGYNGEATDYSTGLQYLRARYYDTKVQRFVQEDDYRGDYTNPASMNRYAYVHGNPVMGIDPSGYWEKPQWMKNAGQAIKNTAKKLVDKGAEKIESAKTYLVETATNYWEDTKKEILEVGEKFKNSAISFKDDMVELGEVIWNDLKSTAQDFKNLVNTIKESAIQFGKDTLNLGKTIINDLKDTWTEAKDLFNETKDKFKENADTVLEKYKETVQNILDDADEMYTPIIEDFNDNADVKAEALKLFEPDLSDSNNCLPDGEFALIPYYRQTMTVDSATAMWEKYNNTFESGVYYEDIAMTYGELVGAEMGVTFVINLDQGWVAQYSHGGGLLTASYLPVDVKITTGQVYGAVDPDDYTEFFLQGGMAVVGEVEEATSIFGGSYGNVTQTGNGVEFNVGATAGLSYYKKIESYNFIP